MSETLDLTTLSDEPVESNVQVEITDASEEPDAEGTEESVVDEEPVETEGPEEPEEATEEEPEEVSEPVEAEEETTEEPVDSEVPEEPEEPVEEEVSEEVPEEPEEPVEETPEEPVEPVAPVEQVAADIRSILTEVPTKDTDSSELSDDLKQRIAELDYLRECCGNWVGQRRQGKSNFLTAWENKSVSVNSSVNYEDVLVQLEKFPEIIRLWVEKKFNKDSNHFKNIQSYTLEKSLFNGKSNGEKVEVLEQLINLLTDCANGKMRINQIEEFIDNLY